MVRIGQQSPKLAEWSDPEDCSHCHKAQFEANHLKCTPGVNTETNNIQLMTPTSDRGAECTHSEIASNTRLGRVVGMPDDVLTLRGT